MDKTCYDSINYSRCHHFIFDCLRKRCRNNHLHFELDKNGNENFKIHDLKTKNVLKFIRNLDTKEFCVNNIIHLTNENLLGLNNPSLLFNLIACLNEIRTHHKIFIRKNEIRSLEKCSNPSLSLATINKLDKLHETCSFTIQLMSENMLAINQCIKIAPFLFMKLINDANINEKLFSFAALYLETFHIAPICCKMQALVHFTTLGYVEEFTTFYLMHHQHTFLQIAKLLYPYINKMNEEDLKRSYFEIIPLRFIELKNPKKLLNILKDFSEYNISVNILRSGRIIRLKNIYDVHHQYFLKLQCIKTFAKCLETLEKLQKSFILYKLGDLSVDETSLFMEPQDYSVLDVFNIKDGKTVQYPPKKMKYFPFCCHCKWRLNESNMLIIRDFPFAFELTGFDICWHNNENEFRTILKQLKECYPSNIEILFADFFKPWVTTSKNTYRYIHESDISVNERCCIELLNWWYNYNFYQSIADLIRTLNIEEGLCFWFEKHTIKMASLYSYDGNDAYKRSLICKNEIIAAFKILQLMLADTDSFEITQDGLISFNEECKFAPIFLNTVKNQKLFVETINKTVQSMNNLINKSRLYLPGKMIQQNSDDLIQEYLGDDNEFNIEPVEKPPVPNNKFLVSIGTEESDNLARIRSKEFWESRKKLQPVFTKIARLLNSALEYLPEEYFYFKAFQSIPQTIFYETDDEKIQRIYENLKQLRANKIPIRMQDNDVIFEWGFSTEIINLSAILNIHLIKHMYGLLTEIVSESNIRLTINVARKITNENQIDEWDNVTDKKEVMRRKSKTIENDLKKCLEIMEKLPQNITALSIVQNGILFIMQYFEMLPSTFIKMKNGYHQKLFETMKLYQAIFENIYKPVNIWENWKAEIENTFVRSGGYSFIANKASIYLKITKLLQPNLGFLRKRDLLTLINCNIITRQLIMRKPKKLLKRLIELNRCKCYFTVTNAGTLMTPYIEFTVNQFVSLNDCEQLSNINKYLAEISKDRIIEKQEYSSDKFCILSNGYFQSMLDVIAHEGTNKFGTMEQKEAYKALLARFFKEFEQQLMKLKLSIIINSDGGIMIGNYVWGYLDSFCMTDPDVALGSFFDQNKIAAFKPQFSYEDTFNSVNKTNNEDSKTDEENQLQILNYISKMENLLKPTEKEMKSIQKLQNIENAIEIAKLINPILKYFSDQMLQSELLRIFPTSLWNSWNNDATKTYSKIKNIFLNFDKQNINWLIKLNGNVDIEQTLVLSMDQLLKIKKFDDLQLLLKMVKNENSEQLICVEDGKYENLEAYKSINVKEDYIAEAKKTAEKLKKNKNTVASNGVLFFNKNLWIQPKTFIKRPEIFKNLSETLIRIFGENVSFKYGKWNESIIPSFSKHFKEEFHEYCRNFCEAVIQILPNAKYQYLKNQQQFLFNDCILISPLAFFDLGNIESFVTSLSNYTNENKTMDEREADFIDNYFKKNSELLKIASEGRLEFIYVRHYCLTEIGKIFLKNRKFLEKSMPDINDQITENSSNFYNLENVVIRNQHIFRTGVLNHLISYNRQLKIKETTFLIALQLATQIDDEFSCKKLFDYTSVIEIVNEYCKGRNIVNGKVVISEEAKDPGELTDDIEKYNRLLKMIKEQLPLIKEQQIKWKYKFSNDLKGLHHWLKHGEIVNN